MDNDKISQHEGLEKCINGSGFIIMKGRTRCGLQLLKILIYENCKKRLQRRLKRVLKF